METDARPTGVHLKRGTLLTGSGINTRPADSSIALFFSSTCVTYGNFF